MDEGICVGDEKDEICKLIWICLDLRQVCIKSLIIGLLFIKNMFPLFLRLSDRNILDPNGPYTS